MASHAALVTLIDRYRLKYIYEYDLGNSVTLKIKKRGGSSTTRMPLFSYSCDTSAGKKDARNAVAAIALNDPAFRAKTGRSATLPLEHTNSYDFKSLREAVRRRLHIELPLKSEADLIAAFTVGDMQQSLARRGDKYLSYIISEKYFGNDDSNATAAFNAVVSDENYAKLMRASGLQKWIVCHATEAAPQSYLADTFEALFGVMSKHRKDKNNMGAGPLAWERFNALL